MKSVNMAPNHQAVNESNNNGGGGENLADNINVIKLAVSIIMRGSMARSV